MNADENLEAVRDLVEWWARAREKLAAKLSPDFKFDDRGLVDNLEDFHLGVSAFAGLSDLSFLELLACGSSTVAALFEATDIVTGLRIRAAWFVRFAGDEIASVTATSSQV